MNDLIRRQYAIDVVEKWFKKINLNGDICLDGLRSLPTADVRENVHGEWRTTDVPSSNSLELTYCNECGWGKMLEEKREYNFCPNCGADMRGRKNETD